MDNFAHNATWHKNTFVSAKDACKYYDIHTATLLRWARDNKIRFITGLGGKNRRYEIVEKELSDK